MLCIYLFSCKPLHSQRLVSVWWTWGTGEQSSSWYHLESAVARIKSPVVSCILALVTKIGISRLSFIKKKSMFHWEINNSPFVQETGLDFNNLQSPICSPYKLYIQFIIMTGWCQVRLTGQERHPESTLFWQSRWVLCHSEQVTVQSGELPQAVQERSTRPNPRLPGPQNWVSVLERDTARHKTTCFFQFPDPTAVALIVRQRYRWTAGGKERRSCIKAIW